MLISMSNNKHQIVLVIPVPKEEKPKDEEPEYKDEEREAKDKRTSEL